MSFSDKSIVVGRQAASILELDLDGCANDYGSSPCTATLALSNFVIQSEDFSTSWPATEMSVVTNITGVTPVGSNNADRLVPSAVASSNHRVVQSFATLNEINTISISAKAEGYSVLQLRFFNGTDGVFADVRFELADGVSKILISTGLVSYRMDQVAGFPGWYRCSATALPPTLGLSNQMMVYVKESGLDTADSFTGDGTSGILVVGAQARPGLMPGKYQATTTADVDGMGVIDDLCFNTFGTCQDTPNYVKETRTYRFIDLVTRPIELIDAYPSIKSVRYGSTQLQPGGKFSVRGKVTVVLQDFAHNDSNVDDYRGERTFDQEQRGTFFGKLKRRNQFYIGRPMRVLEGYLDEPFSLANFRTREYVIENITGPTADGKVTIEGKDVLALARDDRAKAPTASTFTLRSAMTAGQTTMLPQLGEAATIVLAASDKHFRIGEEIVLIGSESPTDTVNITRAQGGTTAASHTIDDSIQECLTYEDEPVIDVIDDLLVNFANIPASFIPTTDWEAEETESLSGYDLETIISTPTGVTKLLQEICEITLIDLWYSDVDQEIKLKLQTPFTTVTETWDDDNNIIADTIKVQDVSSRRLSRVLIYYGIRNFARDLTEPENYRIVNFEIETDKEGVNKYNDEKVRTIFSRWFDSSNAVQVALTSQRLLKLFGLTPIEVTFDIDAKDVETLQTGDVYDLNTRVIQDVDGSQKTTRFQITETKPLSPGSRYRYKSMAFFQDPTPDTLTITGNVTDYDLFVELGGPPGPVDVTLTINAAVDVDGTQGNDAITTVGMHPDSTLHLINNGDVRGHGGRGGGGGTASITSDWDPEIFCFYFPSGSTSGGSGVAGGDAINVTIASITIDNTNGNIWAGAGGGGGGDFDIASNVGKGGGGGGGGLGTDTAAGGALGQALENEHGSCPISSFPGVAGTAGSTGAPGTGGSATGPAGAGGDGGADWGDDGDVGLSGGGAGGPGGFAVRLNGASIVWEGGNTAAKVKGDVA